MARLSPWLWALVGALFGVGFIALLSFGWALIVASVILAVITWLWRGRGIWAALVGFGLAPAAILLFDVVTAPPPCPTQPVIVTAGNYTCGYTPPSYIYIAIAFLAIALLGALILLISRITRARRSDHSPNANGAA